MYCPACGKANPDGSRFCMGCGGALGSGVVPAPMPMRPPTPAPAAPPAYGYAAPPPAPAHGAPPPAPVQRPYGAAQVAAGPSKTSALAIWSLILALVPLCVTQLIALPLAITALVKINASGGRLKGAVLAILGLVGSIGMGLMIPIIASIAIPSLLVARGAADEASVMAALRQIVMAQEQFRSIDRDGNGAMDYWTGDVAGLYEVQSGGAPIALIEPPIAAADDAPIGSVGGERAPYHGYWLRALAYDPEGQPYAQDQDGNGQSTTHPYRWAIVAYPAGESSSGRRCFLVDESGTIYAKPYGGIQPGDSHPGYSYGDWYPAY